MLTELGHLALPIIAFQTKARPRTGDFLGVFHIPSAFIVIGVGNLFFFVFKGYFTVIAPKSGSFRQTFWGVFF
jgi:hypothetical protein